MIIPRILTLIDEAEFISEEFDAEAFLDKFDNGDASAKALDQIKSAGRTAAHIAVSGAISGAMGPAYPILAPILGAIGGGAISSMVIDLFDSILKNRQKITAYTKELIATTIPQKKQELQQKINELKQNVVEKRTKLYREKSELNKELNEMRQKISIMERNKKRLSTSELAQLDKYKKIVTNRMKVLPKLNA